MELVYGKYPPCARHLVRHFAFGYSIASSELGDIVPILQIKKLMLREVE